jgi:hypothetical protein
MGEQEKAAEMMAANVSAAVETLFEAATEASQSNAARLSSVRSLVRHGARIPWDHKPQAVRQMKVFLAAVANNASISKRTRASAKKLLDALTSLTP